MMNPLQRLRLVPRFHTIVFQRNLLLLSTNNGVNNANSNTNVSTNKGANTEITEFPVIIRTSWSAVMRSLFSLSIWLLFHPLDQNTPTLTRNYFLWLLSNNQRSLMLINAEINPGESWLY